MANVPGRLLAPCAAPVFSFLNIRASHVTPNGAFFGSPGSLCGALGPTRQIGRVVASAVALFLFQVHEKPLWEAKSRATKSVICAGPWVFSVKHVGVGLSDPKRTGPALFQFVSQHGIGPWEGCYTCKSVNISTQVSIPPPPPPVRGKNWAYVSPKALNNSFPGSPWASSRILK